MDGLAGRDDGVAVIGTTSRHGAIDSALTRPGRFDHILNVPLPDDKARGAIFDLYAKDLPLENKEMAREMVVQSTVGMSGANIEGIIREAALLTLRANVEAAQISCDSFREAIAGAQKAAPFI